DFLHSWGFWFGHRKTSPSWGEVPFLCLKNLEYQGLKLMQNAQIHECYLKSPQIDIDKHNK
ncbi:hypothetical protein, partial [Paenibacillus aquistagni]|uniref:hypothetical protein n=1 Tax=Paenibacillus aquistagni TaxID=1852522 RepID=UPI001980C734